MSGDDPEPPGGESIPAGSRGLRYLRELTTDALRYRQVRRLRGVSERVAAATGRCDSCGGQVLE